ncbi:hypothetical protein ACFLQI_03205 [Candidatus Undinarchaeota archaeon]
MKRGAGWKGGEMELCVRCTKKTEETCESCGRIICSTCMGISEIYCVDCERVMGIDIMGQGELTKSLSRKKAMDYLFNVRMDKACMIVPIGFYLKNRSELKNDAERYYGVITTMGVMPIEALDFYKRRFYRFEYLKNRWSEDVENFIKKNEFFTTEVYLLDEDGEFEEIRKKRVKVEIVDNIQNGEICEEKRFEDDIFSVSKKWLEAEAGLIGDYVQQLSLYINPLTLEQALDDFQMDESEAAMHMHKAILSIELSLVFSERETVARNLGGCVDPVEMLDSENPFEYLSKRVAEVVYSLAEASSVLSERQKGIISFLKKQTNWADNLRALEHAIRERDGMVLLALNSHYEKHLYKLCSAGKFKLFERRGSVEPWGLYKTAMNGVEFEREYYLENYRKAYQFLKKCGFVKEVDGFTSAFEKRENGRPRKDKNMVVVRVNQLNSEGMSTREIAEELGDEGYNLSHVTVSRILKTEEATQL